jgi:endogenous inhibitor of DNA gyrase (YacG/DUF329 family)
MKPRPRPLPVRPRPRPGETTTSYIEQLALANHMPLRYLRSHLSATASPRGRPALNRLAAVSGRTTAALQAALADLSCAHCGTPLTTSTHGRTIRWCSKACALRGLRRRRKGKPERSEPAPKTTCGHCGKPVKRPQRGFIAQWCSNKCWQRARRERLRNTATPEPTETGGQHPPLPGKATETTTPGPSQSTHPFPGQRHNRRTS